MYRLKVRDVAESQGITQTKLSHLSFVDVKAIRRIWRDPHQNISLPVLDRLAQALHVNIQELIESIPEKK